MSDMQVQAELKLKDSLSRPAGTALDSLGKSAAKTGAAVDAIGKGDAVKAMAKDAKAAAKSMDAIGNEAKDAARSMDAIASESREIGGNLQKAEQRASALRRQLRGVGQTARDAVSHMQRLGKGMDGVWKTGAGIAASGYAAKAALDKPVARETQYLNDANIADVDVNKLRALDAAAVKYGGGTMDGARATRGVLFAQGLDFETTDKVLHGIQRTATATGSEGADLANMVAAGIKAKQFKPEETEKILGMATNAGAEGAFETKDMAKHMPGIFTNAPDMLGVKGAAYHYANLQVMRDAAGSSDEAATLYENLQAFRNGPEAAKNLKKKKVNLTKIYQRAAANGDDMNVAFVDAIQRGVVEKDKLYKSITGKMANAKGPELEALKRQRATRQSELFGQIIGDRQARQAAVALANGKDRRAEVLAKIEDNPLAAVDKFFERVQTSTQTKFDGLGNAWETAMDGFFGKVKGNVDAGLTSATDFMVSHPEGSVALAGATAVGGSFAAGSGAMAVVDFLRKGKGVAPGAGQGTATVVDAAADATATIGKGAKALTGAGRIAKIGGPVGAALAAVDAIATEMDESLTREQKNISHSGTAGGFVGGLGGAAAGAAAGSVVPVVGTIVGAIIGGILGSLGGAEVGEQVGKAIWAPSESDGQRPMSDEYAEAMQYIQQQAAQPIQATIQLNVELDGDKVAEAVEQRQLRESTRR
ncbi:hypothetical protein Defa_20840 [Desulfovibrio sp. TH_2024_36128]|uniref:Phage tail tape measure protein domain-containing protein n=1 Tax=Desulfovibrio falkowii TaxID=3136602 RepID=A0ABQ0EAG5_9BACT